jgi:hypothetical protein
MSSVKNRVKKLSFSVEIAGAAVTARKKAFKKGLPIAIAENGKVYLIYKDESKIEATPEELKKLNLL